MNEKYFLLKYNSNYADKFDVQGYSVKSETDRNNYLKSMEKEFHLNDYYAFSIGTNEEIEYNDMEQFRGDISITEITKEQADCLKSLGLEEFGFFPYPSDF